MVSSTNKSTHESYRIDMFAPIMKSAEGKYLAVLSDDSTDRDEEIVGKSAITRMASDENYLAALMDHENKALNHIAKWVNKRTVEIEGHNAFVAEPHFFKSNPNAMIIKGMLDEGAELAISIGAIVKKYEDTKVNGKSLRTFTELECVEASFCGVGSNKHAKAMAVAKSYKIKNVGENMEFTQKDIDLAVEKKASEYTEKIATFEKQLEEKESEIVKLKKDVEDSDTAKDEAEKKLADAEEVAEKAKKESLEKQRIADETRKEEGAAEDVDKAFDEGKLPIMRAA